MCQGPTSGIILTMGEEITVRHSEPEDHEAVYRIYSGPRAMVDTLGLPFSPKGSWRERLAEKREGEVSRWPARAPRWWGIFPCIPTRNPG